MFPDDYYDFIFFFFGSGFFPRCVFVAFLLLFANCIVRVCLFKNDIINLLAYKIIGQIKPFKCEIWNLWWARAWHKCTASHGGWCGKQRGRKSEIGGELCVINRGNVIFIVLPFYMRNFKSNDISIRSMFVFRLHNYNVWLRMNDFTK